MSYQRQCRSLLVAVTLLLIGCSAGRAGKDDNDLPPIRDREFAARAISAAKADVRLCELAVKQTSNDKVKDFAQALAKQDGLMADKLTDASRDLMIGVDYELEKEAKATFTRLAKLKGAEFDREFIKVMDDHQVNAVSLFLREAKSGTNAAIKAVAEEESPRLKERMREARTLWDAVKDQKD
jgi:putative membrane protein